MLNFLSTLTLTLKQHSFKKKTNPNPDHTMLNFLSQTLTLTLKQHSFKKRQTLTPTARFKDTHLNLCISSCILTPPRFPSPPCFWAFSSLMHLKMFIIFCFIYHDVSCNKYLPFQLCFSWKVLSTLRGDIPFFLCTQTPPLPPFPFLPLSEWFSEKWG